mmetsp:Transcript_20670/g.61744  ORF Transcript_20670/g.61744 Transcript_20670/m.61744 type:complete len:348 (-) Transcript_20670:163-1206(-)
MRLCVAVVAVAAVASAAVQNVTYKPVRDMPADVRARTKALRHKFANASRRGDIRDLILRVTEGEVLDHVLHLSGEALDSLQNSRVSNGIGVAHPFGIDLAVEYVQKHMQTYGYEVELSEWEVGYAPNVISCMRGETTPEQYVILGAHLDDIPREGRAPGANDDGSGSAALMTMASALADSGFKFEKTICFEHYTGEEQGLLGSRAQAQLRASRGDDVIGQIQQDMTAYHLSLDDPGVAFVTDPRATDPDLTELVESIAREYADPLLIVHKNVLSGSSCCSDHQSYAEAGFPAVGMIEPRGYTGDPEYHKETDVVRRNDYDTEQVKMAAQVALAAAASLADVIDFADA